jgi:hypothetical protein
MNTNKNKNQYRLNPLDASSGVAELLEFTEFELNPRESKHKSYHQAEITEDKL